MQLSQTSVHMQTKKADILLNNIPSIFIFSLLNTRKRSKNVAVLIDKHLRLKNKDQGKKV